jgi:hypothetical protein
MVAPEPYLSIVVTSRNDDHGGNLIARMQIFLNSLLEQCNRLQQDAELIIVEWNPPVEKPKLKDALIWPQHHPFLAIRIIEVSSAIHNSFSHAGSLPLFQMIGKNTGIIRAKGEFILATNIDVLFSDELISFILSGPLEKGSMYRIDRDDIDANIPPDVPGYEQLTYCREHILRMNRRLYTWSVHENWHLTSFFLDYIVIFFHKLLRRLVYGEAFLHLNASGDFTLMHRQDWCDLRGYPEFEIFSLHLDSILCYAAYYSGIREVLLSDPMHLYHIEHAIGSGATPGTGSKLLNERLVKKGLKSLRYRDLVRYMNQMRRMPKPVTFNTGSWGLSRYQLPETQV